MTTTLRRRLLLACAIWLCAFLLATPRAAQTAANRVGDGTRTQRDAPGSLALHPLRELRGLPQRPRGSLRRGRLDRRDLAIDDDGELGTGSVLAGQRAARDDRPPDAQRGDSGRVRRVPHADGHADQRARPGRRVRCSRTCRSPAPMPRPLHRLASDGISCTVCHQISSERLGTRDELQRRVRHQADTARRRARDLRAAQGRRRPQDDHALGDRFRAGRGAAYRAERVVRVVPHAHHAGVRAERRGRSDRCPSR